MSSISITESMADRAQEAIELVRERIGATLTFSSSDVEDLEAILTGVYDALQDLAGNETVEATHVTEQARRLAVLFGSYLGEVVRRKWGGEWQQPDVDGAFGMPCLQIANTVVWPIERVYRRLSVGPSENVWDYFRSLEQELSNRAGQQ